MTWTEWAQKHCNLFGLITTAEASMVGEWANHFARNDYSPDELDSASDDLANRPPAYRSEHLAALQTIVRARRAARLSESSSRARDERHGASCAICDDHGWAVVPHWRAEYRAKRHTCAVACSCAAGRNLQQSLLKQERSVETLERYEQFVPRWRDLAEEWRTEAREASEHRSRAGTLDDALGRIVAKIQDGAR